MTSDVPGAFPTLGAFAAIVSGLRRKGISDREIAEAAIGTGVSLIRNAPDHEVWAAYFAELSTILSASSTEGN